MASTIEIIGVFLLGTILFIFGFVYFVYVWLPTKYRFLLFNTPPIGKPLQVISRIGKWTLPVVIVGGYVYFCIYLFT